jgi:predicted O-methyltransferase YrrM
MTGEEMSAMIENPEAYFRQFIPPRDELLLELEAEANREDIPIVGPVAGELLYILARTMRAGRILELGTATGYSTIYLARACEAHRGKVVTLDMDQDIARRALENLIRAGLDEHVEIRVGNALDVMTALPGLFDLIFLDIDKADYVRALPHCARLLRPGGLLVADNTGFEDADDFNQAVLKDPEWQAVNLWTLLPLHSPEQDGLCLALRV